MEEKEVVQVIQHYRHELMNQLQVIHGYVSMNKLDQVKDKMATCMKYYEEERKLLNLSTPQFILWVLAFNQLYKNSRLTYNLVLNDDKLFGQDVVLVSNCQYIMESLVEITDEMELYNVHFQLEKCPELSDITCTFKINGVFNQQQVDAYICNRGGNITYELDPKSDLFICKFSLSHGT